MEPCFNQNQCQVQSGSTESSPVVTLTVADLPANLVHSILQRAKKLGLQDYAGIRVIRGRFTSREMATLQRSHYQ